MRIVRFRDASGRVNFGAEREDGTVDVLAGDPLAGVIEKTGERVTVRERLAPVEPANIFCIGLNYREHARETGAEIPEQPVVFMKPRTAVQDPGQPIRIPRCCTRGPEVDYEVELAVVIGKAGRDIAEERAMEHVLGFTCANDVSARKWQKHGGGGQWIRGKGFDTFCPLGPVLVTADELGDPYGLRIWTRVNGQVMQDSRTSDMIFTIPQLIAFLSQDTTLLAGTVILTGTPPGVGVARTPQVFLKPGDEVTVAIEGIGELSNTVTSHE